jgi:hypothetical protein
MISNKKDLATKIIPLSGLPRPCPKLTESEESGKGRKKKNISTTKRNSCLKNLLGNQNMRMELNGFITYTLLIV